MAAKDAKKKNRKKHEVMKRFVEDITQHGTLVEIVLRRGLTVVAGGEGGFLGRCSICKKSKLKSLDTGIILGSKILGRYDWTGTYAGSESGYDLNFILPEGKINLTEDEISSLTPYRPEQTYKF